VTPNDPAADKDSDFGPNGRQNFPVLTSATNSDGKTIIKGSLNSDDLQTYTYSSSPVPPPTLRQRRGQEVPRPEARHHQRRRQCLLYLQEEVPKGQFVTATATSLLDGTSEFSNARKVVRRR
jgi:hypothetical protein